MLLLVGAAAAIYFSCELFVNAVEHPVDTARKVWQALGDLI